MPLTVINGPTIAAGEAVSDVVDITSGNLVRLTMPAAWTEAPLTFLISSDGEFFNPLYDYHGHEVAIPVSPGAGIIFPRDFFVGVGFIRFCSGNADHEVPQPEARAFSVAVLKGAILDASEPPVAAARKTPRKTAHPRRKHR